MNARTYTLTRGTTTTIIGGTIADMDAANVPPLVQGSLGYGARMEAWAEWPDGHGWYAEPIACRITRN
jgi:hypothetical protein